MKNKKINMQAFVGVDFDCERSITRFAKGWGGEIAKYDPNFDGHYECDTFYRPRMNKAQVLNDEDYAKLPDGLVWCVRQSNYKICQGMPMTQRGLSSKQIRARASNASYIIEWVMCIGVEPEYAEWGRERGMGVISK